jgi:uncharacterized protein YxeA
MKKMIKILYILVILAILFTFAALIIKSKNRNILDEPPNDYVHTTKTYNIDKAFTIDSYNQPWHVYTIEEVNDNGMYIYRINASITNNRLVTTDTSRHIYELYSDKDLKLGKCYNDRLADYVDAIPAEIASGETVTGYLYCDSSSKASKFRIKAVTGGIYHEDTKKVDYDYENYDIDIE